jgi:hypothetical protein
MNRTITALVFAGMMGLGLQAVADEPPTDQSAPADQTAPPSSESMATEQSMNSDQAAPADQQQFMKDCMAKAKTANNGMSQKDMKKSCMQQYKTSLGQAHQPVTPAH